MPTSDVIVEVVKALVPPKTNELEPQQRWRWVVFVAILVLALSQGVHIALSCGYMPAIYSGFASAASTSDIQKRVDVIATLSIGHEIRTKVELLCGTKANDGVKHSLSDDVGVLQKEYFDINHVYYPTPACELL